MTYKITYILSTNGTKRIFEHQDLLICSKTTERQAAKYFRRMIENTLPSWQKVVNVRAFKQ